MKKPVARFLPTIAFAAALLVGCFGGGRGKLAPERIDNPAIENYHRLTKTIYSGGDPRGKEAFEALAKAGVRTLLSVDGARPDVEAAEAAGLRYVHLPIGYDGIDTTQTLSILRAAEDLPRPLFIHCHHGKHRGPAAALLIALQDGACTPQEGVATMEKLGTGKQYKGLYAAVEQFQRPTKKQLDAAPADFPSVAATPPFVDAMAQMNIRFEHLEACRDAGWKTPESMPDVEPRHEALQLRELFTEMLRKETESAQRTQAFLDLLADSEKKAEALHQALSQPGQDPTAALRTLGQACSFCHQGFRH